MCLVQWPLHSRSRIIVPRVDFKVKATGELVLSVRGGGVLRVDMCLMGDNNVGVCSGRGCRGLLALANGVEVEACASVEGKQ